MLILIPTLVSEFPVLKFLFGRIRAKKVKVVCFAWKLAHMVSGRCWFLFQHLFSEFQTKNRFWGNFGQKGQIRLFCMKIGTNGILRMRMLISKLFFWISKPKSILGRVRPSKWNGLFCLILHNVSRGCWFVSFEVKSVTGKDNKVSNESKKLGF